MEKLQTATKVEKIVLKKIPCAHYSASTINYFRDQGEIFC